jgi:hypothetical protein
MSVVGEDYFSARRKATCLSCDHDDCPLRRAPKCQLQALLCRHNMACPHDKWWPVHSDALP